MRFDRNPGLILANASLMIDVQVRACASMAHKGRPSVCH
jgi:hypothetical protein